MMFRCFLRPRARPDIPPRWRPSLARSGSRGIKLSKLPTISRSSTDYATAALSMSGREWLNHLAKNGIGHHSDFKTIQAMKNIITVKASTQHTRKFFDDVYFADIGHPFAEAVVRRYLRHHKERPLWCHTFINSAEKAIVRGKAKYRAHAALNQALKDAGYDTAGRRIAGSKVVGRNGAVSELFGTVQITTHVPKEVLKVPFVNLHKFFENAVVSLEQRLGIKAGSRTTGRDSQSSRTQAQRPQRQAHSSFTKRTDTANPGNLGTAHVSQRGTSYGRGDGGGDHGRSRNSGKREIWQQRNRENKPVKLYKGF